MIIVTYEACDGFRARRVFDTLKGAQRYAHNRIGAHPEIGHSYAVSADGIGVVRVQGATLVELFPAPVATLRGPLNSGMFKVR